MGTLSERSLVRGEGSLVDQGVATEDRVSDGPGSLVADEGASVRVGRSLGPMLPVPFLYQFPDER